MTLLSKFTLANCKQLQNICEKLASYPTTLISLRSDENLSLDVAIGINESFIVELPCNTLRKTSCRQCKEDAYKNILC